MVYVTNSGVFHKTTIYLSLAILRLIKLDLLHAKYREKTGMAKLLMSTSQNEEKQFTRPHPNKVHKHWLD